MPRTARIALGGMVFHVLNRGVGRMRLFHKDADYEAFERCIEKTLASRPMRICSYVLMPNHWHFILHPENDGDLPGFMQKLTIMHARKWQEHRNCRGSGHVYQGRYKSFPIQEDAHFYIAVKYVERNALRAKLVTKAEEWRWSSLWHRVNGTAWGKKLLHDWPLPIPADWNKLINAGADKVEEKNLDLCILRNQPYGDLRWAESTTGAMGLE